MTSFTKDRDLSPAPYTTEKKQRGESFDKAMNPPNNPTKDQQPDSFNVTHDYPTYKK